MALELDRPDLARSDNFIDGIWQPSGAGAHYDVCDPATGEAIATVADSTAADAQAATVAAHRAFDSWRQQPAAARAKLLKRWHALILEHTEDLARLISREQGKPLAEARGEVAYGASYVDWFAAEAVRSYGDIIPAPVGSKRMLVTKEPVGVVAAITPWNFPLAMIARKIAPALAAGCTVVAKPAEDTPLTALALVALAEEAGLPAGVLNIVTSSREKVADVVGAWLEDARVRKITFTGSTAVGKLLARDSAPTLKRLSLELGGNAPFIVFEDADLDAAVEGLMAAKFRNGGQTCVSPNRVYVQESVYEAFADKLVARVQSLRVGPGDRDDSQIGPMINARAVDKIERHVQDALARGAMLLTGGQRLNGGVTTGPNYYAPTVLGDASHDMALAQDETFGPVVPLFRFRDEEEVVDAANDTPYGLAAYFFSRDVARIWRLAERLQTGLVGINEGALAAESAPFGGIKESGYGREGSRYGLDDYMATKYLCQGNLA
ncbi:NAD-dependent succinate-semialdehyde dehydrogenase [Halomonas heilongjiangensis]|uniref:Succinate-semialdehyde dehydrogenase (NADP(+)) n=1 Tax=Halomonas heilongjiangensis TaxID=1387883 RepID=A0A2N7TFF9_9GAMM|nr:NAD-dependent succinate-semialdehyde dehydrogenase [Halomonas heilongjiangensis]PMR66923.1 succinate-semialdehyde dehydrogenase (NADP(+)) [Halomonas heilongjiangensis]PXX88567.1 succinate-semialdehyde dehydrogenase (NADP(+)) [Halomonas heilongjiangensis]